MQVRLSSKGQLIIPKRLREDLGLSTGDQLEARVENNRIILEPIQRHTVLDALYGRFKNDDFLTDLEQEHHKDAAQ
jgi:AbrB family looped-hinge helix DNA binding protein